MWAVVGGGGFVLPAVALLLSCRNSFLGQPPPPEGLPHGFPFCLAPTRHSGGGRGRPVGSAGEGNATLLAARRAQEPPPPTLRVPASVGRGGERGLFA